MHSVRWILITICALLIMPAANASDFPNILPRHEQSSEYLLSPSLWGPLGGFHSVSAQRPYGEDLGFQIGLHGQYFEQSGLIIAGQDTSRFIGEATVSIVPIPYFEIFGRWQTISNTADTAAALLQQLGNFSVGAKFGFDPTSFFSIAALFQAEYLNSAGDLGFTSSAWNYLPMLLLTFDLTRLEEPLPLRFHTNAGYRFNNSIGIADGNALTASQQFFYNVVPADQVVLAAGVEVPIDFVTFIAEYSTEKAIGTGVGSFTDSPHRATVGLKIFPTKHQNFSIDAATDIGLFNDFSAAEVIAQPDYNIIFGLTFTMMPRDQVVQLVSDEPKLGGIAVAVVDAATQQPVGNAIVTFPEMELTRLQTHPQKGSFELQGLRPGLLSAKVVAEDYAAADVTFDVLPGKTITPQVALKKHVVKKKGELLLKITDADGKALQGQLGFLNYPSMKPTTIPQKGLRIKMTVGRHRLLVGSEGFEAEEHDIFVEKDKKLVAEFVLREKDDRIKLTKEKIQIADRIYFDSGKWALKLQSQALLNRVADLIADNSQLQLISIEGYTDSIGKESYNIFISRKRAEAVMEYVISRGVSRDRFQFVGHGPANPIADNSTKAGRATNRRVEFRIVDIAEPGTKKGN